MTDLTVGDENGAPIELYYEDHGSGIPVVLIHGFPLTRHAWEKQQRILLDAGYRVISYDRRGSGDSTQAGIGYDYDTFTADLRALLEHLDLQDVVLIGHSMGTGEVTHYLGQYGSDRISRAVLISTLGPMLLKTADNPEGVDGSIFDGTRADIIADRPQYIKSFVDTFYNADEFKGTRVSDAAWQMSFMDGVNASPIGTLKSVTSWLTDFRGDLPKIDVPTLILHGTADRVLPIDNTARRMPGKIKDLTYIEIEGGPHGMAWTHSEEINAALLAFLRGNQNQAEASESHRAPATVA